MDALWSRLAAAPEGRAGLTREAWIALVVIALVTLMPGVFSIPPMDRDESRYAQASVQMIESGDYVDIRFQDDPRHVKPVGIYWMQAASAHAFGGADAPIGAFRLPSLLGALIAVVATAWLGARLISPAAGLAAGLFIAATLMLQVEARTAKTDAMLLAAGVIAQSALLWLMLRTEGRRPKFWGAPAIFWAATGAAILIKGPIVTMVSAFTLFGFAAWKRDPGLILKTRPLPGLALACAVFLPWIAAITAATNGGFIEEAVGHALFGKVGEADDSHAGPFGYHTLLAPVTLWPGAALLGLAGLAAWRRRGDDLVVLLLLWLLPAWLVFELIHTKLPHYVLPSVPAIALLAGLGLTELSGLLASRVGRVVHGVASALALLAGLVIVALPIGARLYFEAGLDAASLITTGIGAVALVALLMLALKPTGARLLATGAATAAFYAGLFGVVTPSIDKLWPSDRAMKIVRSLQGCDAKTTATAGYREPSNVFHFGAETPLTDGRGAADHLAANPACGVAVVEASEAEAFAEALAERGLEVRSVGRFAGHNAVKGRDITLTVFVAEGSPLVR